MDNQKNQIDFYDIVIGIDSLLSLQNGWEVHYSAKGSENYLKQKDQRSCIVGVLGNGNKGKSFLLQKISESELLSGYSVKTVGLSLLYPKNIQKNIICLDTAGQETPLKDKDRDKIFEGKGEDAKYDMMSNLARDRQLTELFLQSFVIQESNILIAVVGQLCSSEQKLLSRIKNECNKRNKLLFIVHNLNTLTLKKEVEDYIDETLKKSLTFKLNATNFIDLRSNSKAKPKETNLIYYTEEKFIDDHNDANDKDKEKDKGLDYDDDINQSEGTVVHLIIAYEDSEAGKYYNQPVYDFLKQQLACDTNLKPFPVVERVVKHLIKMSNEIMEEPLVDANDLEIKDKMIKLKSNKDIQLKKCLVDELGKTNFFGRAFIPKYSYDIDSEKNLFVVSFEVSGAFSGIKSSIRTLGENNVVKITGIKTPPPNDQLENYGASTQEFGEFIIEFRILVTLFQFKSTVPKKKEKKNGELNLYFEIQDMKQKDVEQVIEFETIKK